MERDNAEEWTSKFELHRLPPDIHRQVIRALEKKTAVRRALLLRVHVSCAGDRKPIYSAWIIRLLGGWTERACRATVMRFGFANGYPTLPQEWEEYMVNEVLCARAAQNEEQKARGERMSYAETTATLKGLGCEAPGPKSTVVWSTVYIAFCKEARSRGFSPRPEEQREAWDPTADWVEGCIDVEVAKVIIRELAWVEADDWKLIADRRCAIRQRVAAHQAAEQAAKEAAEQASKTEQAAEKDVEKTVVKADEPAASSSQEVKEMADKPVDKAADKVKTPVKAVEKMAEQDLLDLPPKRVRQEQLEDLLSLRPKRVRREFSP